MKYIFTLLFISLYIFSCQKKKIEEQAKKDETEITTYIAQHDLKAIAAGDGLYYTMDKVGTGTSPSSTSQVRVAYKGYLTNGTVFDQSDSVTGVIFSLQNVIEGWTKGIPYFKEGGKGKLLIPSVLGYGTKGTTGIPANSVLIFDINLLDVY